MSWRLTLAIVVHLFIHSFINQFINLATLSEHLLCVISLCKEKLALLRGQGSVWFKIEIQFLNTAILPTLKNGL